MSASPKPGHLSRAAPFLGIVAISAACAQVLGFPSDPVQADAGAGASSDASASAADGASLSPVIGYVAGGRPGPGAVLAGCAIFPPDNAWNVRVDGPDVPLTTYYSLPDASPHPDIGALTVLESPGGYPFNVVDASAPYLPVEFACFAGQSDPGPQGWSSPPAPSTSPCPLSNAVSGQTTYPFSRDLKIEGNWPPDGGPPWDPGVDPYETDVLVLRRGDDGGPCSLWEAFDCKLGENPIVCFNGAHWDLSSNALRDAGNTSANGAGLPYLAGLVKFDEATSDAGIAHALRVTFLSMPAAYLPPATDSNGRKVGAHLPVPGLRLRMKATTDVTTFSAPGQAIAAAMKTYGLIVGESSSDWYFQGDSDDRWIGVDPATQQTYIDELVAEFKTLGPGDFEVIDPQVAPTPLP